MSQSPEVYYVSSLPQPFSALARLGGLLAAYKRWLQHAWATGLDAQGRAQQATLLTNLHVVVIPVVLQQSNLTWLSQDGDQNVTETSTREIVAAFEVRLSSVYLYLRRRCV